MSCRAQAGQLVHACAWCEDQKPEAERLTGPNVSHGICPTHRDELNIQIPLHGAIARLTSEEYLGQDARAEIARSLVRVIRALDLRRARATA